MLISLVSGNSASVEKAFSVLKEKEFSSVFLKIFEQLFLTEDEQFSLLKLKLKEAMKKDAFSVLSFFNANKDSVADFADKNGFIIVFLSNAASSVMKNLEAFSLSESFSLDTCLFLFNEISKVLPKEEFVLDCDNSLYYVFNNGDCFKCALAS